MKRNNWSDSEVEAHWDRVADIYVRENTRVKHIHDQRFQETIRYLELQEGQKILNVSSRDCEAEDYIRRATGKVEILHAEISSGLIRIAGEIHPKVRQYKIETYSSLPFMEEEFDRIISLETLEHVSDPDKFLYELFRVAKSGAKMVLSCPPATSEIPYRFYTFFFGGHGEGPHRFPRSAEVKESLQNSGWKLIIHRGTILIPFGPLWLQRQGEKVIQRFQQSFVSELGIRQIYVCEKP